MLLGSRMQNFIKLAQLGRPENGGELFQSSKTGKTTKIKEISHKWKKTII